MTRIVRNLAAAAMGAAAGITAAAWTAPDSAASDHADSPQVMLNPQVDINDLYVFQSPQNAANAVLIMTVCPFAGTTGATTFQPRALHIFRIDLDGDGDEDQSYFFNFSRPDRDGNQGMRARARGRVKWSQSGSTRDNFLLPNESKCQATMYDDPFFFDLVAFRDGLSFDPETATNFFRGLNTLAIVLEVPKSSFGTDTVGVWTTTHRRRMQVDRKGRPAINTVLIPAAKKDVFNRSHPKNDAQYRADAAAVITALGNGENAEGLAAFLLPDILTVDFGAEGGTSFPNGRALADDVIDVELQILSGNPGASDFVANDSAFLSVFPYLAPANP